MTAVLALLYRLGFFRRTLFCTRCRAFVRTRDPYHGALSDRFYKHTPVLRLNEIQ